MQYNTGSISRRADTPFAKGTSPFGLSEEKPTATAIALEHALACPAR